MIMSFTGSDALYLSLISSAEFYRTRRPRPSIIKAIKCLTAILHIPNQSPRIEARTLTQLGISYRAYTKNIDAARLHLEKAFVIAINQTQFEDVIGEAASVLADVYIDLNDIASCKEILWRGLERSKGHMFWQCRLLLQLSQVHVTEGDFSGACQYLQSGVDMCRASNNFYAEGLFLLSKALVLLMENRGAQETEDSFVRCRQIVDHFERISSFDNNVNASDGDVNQRQRVLPRKELLGAFLLALDVCNFTQMGQLKSANDSLRRLQNIVQALSEVANQTFSSSNPTELLQWLPADYLCILVYLLTVVNLTQRGWLEKALKYSEKCQRRIERLCSASPSLAVDTFVGCVQLTLLEHEAVCRMITGCPSAAVQQISLARQICVQSSKLSGIYGPQLHTLIGMYCMCVDLLPDAELHFNKALKVTSCPDLWTFVSLNLALVFLHSGREQQMLSVLAAIGADRIETRSLCLKAAIYLISGFYALRSKAYADAKRYLRDALALADREDLNRLSSCTLMLLGHLFLSSSNMRDCLNMINPAMQVARSVPDVNVQVWGASVLKEIYAKCKDNVKEAECVAFQCSMNELLCKEKYQSVNSNEHKLVMALDVET